MISAYSFGQVCFLEESYKNMKKIKIWKFWKHPLFDIREYAPKAGFILKRYFFQPWAVSCGVSIRTQCHRSTIKRSCRAFQMSNRIMCHKRETLLKLNFFQLMEWYYSWDSILISIYRIDTQDLKNTNACVRKRWRNAFHLRMNSVLTTSSRRIPRFFADTIVPLQLSLFLPTWFQSSIMEPHELLKSFSGVLWYASDVYNKKWH